MADVEQDKEANKPPNPKPDQDVSPPLVSVSKRKFSLFYFFLTALLKFCKL
jgi:hypothetical protein